MIVAYAREKGTVDIAKQLEALNSQNFKNIYVELDEQDNELNKLLNKLKENDVFVVYSLFVLKMTLEDLIVFLEKLKKKILFSVA